ncbi:aminotransferase class I/II-fold pyridoxal phosphate-dependent enzyme [Pectinatus brassicae]|uniref:Cystathionine beta-lyase family protein involved in aluminum resistance n=1 Tax=Pectinatus brassicae TaxID=862415 RepID=A0A840UDV4_9FIRM|nr:methionine gamma-lyase family protein [Pectinatus brassicae]MBB5335901.1 cystathionine beta-lyase family protein involved in aluminum resistance [Pectinatus brassicae]
MFSPKIVAAKEKALEKCQEYFISPDKAAEHNTLKILNAMRQVKVSDAHFNTSTGYAYDDIGRGKLEELYAQIFKGEKALVRTQFVSGTHTLSTVLFGILRPGDELLSIMGAPYDTMRTVIGQEHDSCGSLKEFKINYQEAPLNAQGKPDFTEIKKRINKNTKMVLIQRSRGYSMRPTLTVDEIGEICTFVKKIKPDCICFIDNCYGEFIEEKEPLEVGADIMGGSLIKNPGGGIAPTGGYIVGRADLVDMASYRMTSPGMGAELGASLENNRLLFQGLFLAPHVVAQAVKSAVFAAAFFTELGYLALPKISDKRGDIIQAIELKTPENLIAFCRGIQKYSPVDSFAAPEPWDMPGYEDQIIMAAGTFVQGASIELSADGPMRAPYSVYMQGALTFEHGVIAAMGAAQELENIVK